LKLNQILILFESKENPANKIGVHMAIIGTIFGVIVGIMVLEVVISAIFLMIGAKLAKIEDSTFGKSVLASLGCALITWLVTVILSLIPVIGTLLGLILGIIFSLFIIKGVFETTMGKAFLAWVFNILAKVVAIVIAVLTFASALMAMFKSI
jgi:hypothetical protein